MDSQKQDESPKTTREGSEDKGTDKHPPPPPTFGRTAFAVLLVSLLIYGYQTTFLGWVLSTSPPAVDVDVDSSFDFKSTGTPNDFLPDVAKMDAVVSAFRHAWSAYERDALGCDEYHPLSKTGSNLTEGGGIGYAIIDAIDTMQIMGLKEEYAVARNWIANKLDFDRDGNFNTFETTIRVLGGLLSAYHLSNEDPLFLEKAVELADRMLPAFDTPFGLPHPMINLKKRKGVEDEHMPGLTSTAEASTIQLEFRYLSYLTDNEDYWDKAEAVMRLIDSGKLASRLVPIYMSAKTGQFLVSDVRLGSRSDSYYEYLLKQYLQTGKSESGLRQMYREAMDAIHSQLVYKGLHKGHTFTSEIIPSQQQGGQIGWRLSPKQDHLVCFFGGSLMLGAVTTDASGGEVSIPPDPKELTSSGQRDWTTGFELIKTCMHTYDTPTGLSPEIAHFYTVDDGQRYKTKKRDWYIKGNTPNSPSYDARYILRPETVESLFIAFRLTGDPRYREYGWKIFQAIEKYCKVESGGYASILNVDATNSLQIDKMETFFLSETLKYLYLLFSDASVLPLEKYVFNTEAHPFPIFQPTTRTAFS